MTARMIIPLEVTDSNLIEAGTTVPENDAPEWDNVTNFDQGDEVIRNHNIYTSAIDGNVDNDPLVGNQSIWIKLTATNRWKVFDGYLQDSASQADSAAWRIETTNFINGLVLFGVQAATVQVTLDAGADGIVYDETFEMADDDHITDYDLWFFTEQIRATELVVAGLPPYPGEVTVTLTDTGQIVRLSQLSLGNEIDLGITVNGFDQDIELFSSKQPDIFGRVSAVKRGSSDILEPNIKVLTSRVPYLRRTLKSREALPTVYLFDGPAKDNEYVAFGDFERLRTNSQFGEYSDMQITIREYV